VYDDISKLIEFFIFSVFQLRSTYLVNNFKRNILKDGAWVAQQEKGNA
jgi:hypothetical protein